MRPGSVLKLLAFVLPPGLDSSAVAAALGASQVTTDAADYLAGNSRAALENRKHQPGRIIPSWPGPSGGETADEMYRDYAGAETRARKAALSMFERFTDRARRVVVLAQEEARMLNHNYVGSEHILLGLIREDGGVAAQALGSLGVTEERARQQVEEVVGAGQTGPQRGHLPFTPQAKKILQLSLREAIALGHAYIGTEHILLGLVRGDDGAAIRVLNGLGVDPDRVRQQVIQLVSARRVQEEPGTGRVTGRGKRKMLSELRGRLDALDWRLSVLEQRVGASPDLARLDQEISQVRGDKESAIDAQDFENAAVLRDREQQLLGDKAARLQEWAALPSLSDEVERLRDLLRRHGIDPQDGVA
jgi:Clp amino terminal domain, pathogenicity island component/UvrB/uvrC motif